MQAPKGIGTERSGVTGGAGMGAVDGALRARAKAGDAGALAELTAPYRGELHLHGYRLLGSVLDADDLLQETLVAAWRGLPGFVGRSSLRTWLYRIATNRCVNAVRDRRRRPPLAPAPPFEPPEPTRRSEVTWLQPYPDTLLSAGVGPSARYEAKETARPAFVAALQRLPPRQLAAVVLCDGLDLPVAEGASLAGTSPTALKGLLRRGRATLCRQAPAGRAAAPAPGSAAEAELAGRFAVAYGADDVAGVVALLADDAWLTMPPAPHEHGGWRRSVGSSGRAPRGGPAGASGSSRRGRTGSPPSGASSRIDPEGRRRRRAWWTSISPERRSPGSPGSSGPPSSALQGGRRALPSRGDRQEGGRTMTEDRRHLEPGPDHPITVEPAADRVTVRVGEVLVAETDRALELREGSHPPVRYVPLEDVRDELLRPSELHTYCP